MAPAEATDHAQRREWRVERIGWAIMGLIVLAGLLGLFGGGALAHRKVASGALTLSFERIVRSNAPTSLSLTIGGAAHPDTIRIWLTQDYLSAVQLQHMVPQPARSYSESGRLVMDFAPAPDQGPYTIVIEVEPARIGAHEAVVGLGSDSVRFAQFVLP